MTEGIAGIRRSGSARSGRQRVGRQNANLHSRTITPELVNQVADKVYAMLLFDLRIEQERERSSLRKPFAEQGGW
jgi:hypothetical protein